MNRNDTPIHPIYTADGIEVSEGDRVYNYYDMEPGTIGHIDAHPQPDTMKGQTTATPQDEWSNHWFAFLTDDGGRTHLDGSRICSIAHAERQGWL